MVLLLEEQDLCLEVSIDRRDHLHAVLVTTDGVLVFPEPRYQLLERCDPVLVGECHLAGLRIDFIHETSFLYFVVLVPCCYINLCMDAFNKASKKMTVSKSFLVLL